MVFLLCNVKWLLVVFGKGVVYFYVEGVFKNLVELIGIFFLVILMGKGLLFDVYFLFVVVV